MDSAVSAVLRKELGVRGAARKFSVNRHSLTTRLLLIERSERDDLDSGRNHRLSDAVNAVRNKEITKNGAARHFAVPRSTLSDRLRTAKEELQSSPRSRSPKSEQLSSTSQV